MAGSIALGAPPVMVLSPLGRPIRVAETVQVSAGRLQATRFSRQYGPHARIVDEDAALAYLRG